MRRAPDLERFTPDGYAIAVRYLPTLAAPTGAVLEVSRAGRSLETVSVDAARGLEVFRHPCSVSPIYRRALAPVAGGAA